MTGIQWTPISSFAKDLVSKMLDRNTNRRISVAEVLAHDWLNGYAPAADLGPDYSRRVKGLALRQRLKRFFIDNDIVSRSCIFDFVLK